LLRSTIDDELMQAVLQATGLKTKREAVEAGLRALLQLSRQQQGALRRLRGKVPNWEGDLEAMRLDAPDESDAGGTSEGSGNEI